MVCLDGIAGRFPGRRTCQGAGPLGPIPATAAGVVGEGVRGSQKPNLLVKILPAAVAGVQGTPLYVAPWWVRGKGCG